MKAETLSALQYARTNRRAVTLATRLSDAAEALVYRDDAKGELAGDAAILAAAQRAMDIGKSETVDIGGAKIFLNVYVPPPRLIIVGAVHIAQSLAPMAAMLEFDVTVVDPRGAWATTQRFPGVKVIQDWADEAFQAMGLDSSTAVVTPDARSQARRSGARIGAQVGRLLHRRAGQPPHPCQAQGAAGGGRHHRGDVRARARAGRSQYRRQVAGRDRRIDPRPDHRGPCASPRSPVCA